MDRASTVRPAHRVALRVEGVWRRVAPPLGLAALGLTLAAATIGLIYGGSPDKLAGGVTIAGVDVGGLTATEAVAQLESRARELDRRPVTFTAAGSSWKLAPSQLGVKVDWERAVRATLASTDGVRPLRGLRRLKLRVSGSELTPTVESFESVVAYTVREMARTVDKPSVEPSLRLAGLRPELVGGTDGRKLDQNATTELILRSLATLHRAPVALPVHARPTRVSTEDLEQAQQAVRTALSAPVVLEVGSARLRVPRWELAQLVSLPRRGATDVTIGGKGADRWIAKLQERVDRPARDATFRVRVGGIEVVEARPGRVLDIGKAVEQFEQAVFAAAVSDRVAVLPMRESQPERSTAEARAMGITGVVGSYTTTYGGTEGRLANVKLVSDLIDGTLIAPGATFSFNETTGERNAARGFQEAPVIINGELQNGIGGGVCQVSTTVFNAAFEAGLGIASRTNHALYISHYPTGRDATVNYPDVDLVFVNDTEKWLLLRTFVGAGSLTVNLYGAPQERRVETETLPLTVSGKRPITRTPDPELTLGFRVIDKIGTLPRHTSVTRRVYDASGALLHEDTWWSYYRGEPTLVRVGTKPKPQPAPTPEAPKAEEPASEPPAPGAGASGASGFSGLVGELPSSPSAED